MIITNESKTIELAPVIIFAYNRPKHLEKTLEALEGNSEISKTDIFIFSDAAQKDEDERDVSAVRQIIESFASQSQAKSVTVYCADINKGLANSVIDGVTQIIKVYKKVIVLEDDLIVSKYFLSYMNDALEKFKENEEIWSVTGYSLPFKSLAEYKYNTYVTGRACSWSWATWEDRWNMVDWTVPEYKKFKNNFILRWSFGKYGSDMPRMLDEQMTTGLNSWAIRWCFYAWKNRMKTVVPTRSLVKCIGNDGSGTHGSTSVGKYNTYINSERPVVFEEAALIYDKNILKENRYYHESSLKSMLYAELYWFAKRNCLLSLLKK